MFNAIIGVIKFELILLFVFFISLYLSFCILWDGVFFCAFLTYSVGLLTKFFVSLFWWSPEAGVEFNGSPLNIAWTVFPI